MAEKSEDSRDPPYDLFLGGSLAAFGFFTFLESGNFLFLLGGLLAGGAVVFVSRVLLGGGVGRVRVRCKGCQALNGEDAKFCAQCGHAM